MQINERIASLRFNAEKKKIYLITSSIKTPNK